jgi:hypothetical protein
MKHTSCWSLLVCCVLLCCPSFAKAVTRPGIVFDSEAISTPANAWLRDRWTADHWCLWTKEDRIVDKRTGGAVLASPSVKQDRSSPAEGAPPLHSVVRGLKPGLYQVYVSAPGRPLAYSLEGKQWQRYAGGELNLGRRQIGAEPFEIWIDDRFAAPKDDPGPGYYDYVRFLPVPQCSANVAQEEAWNGLEHWLNTTGRGGGVFIADLELSGFEREANGGRLRGAEPGDSFTYVVRKAGKYWPALAMADAAGVMEELSVTVNGRKVGHLAATGDAGEPALFCFRQPLQLQAGDRLSFICASKAAFRVEKLFLATTPIVLPEPKCEYLTAWSPLSGNVELCWTTNRAMASGLVEYGTGGFQHKTELNAYRGRNHRACLGGLDPATQYQARVVTQHDGHAVVSSVLRFHAAPPPPPATVADTIPLVVAEPSAEPRVAWPTTIGMPFARGRLARLEDLRLFDPQGRPVVLQAELFSRWPDGSVKWAVLSFLADTARQPVTYHLQTKSVSENHSSPLTPAPLPQGERGSRGGKLLTVSETAQAWTLTAGGNTLAIGKQQSFPLGGLEVVDAQETRLTCGPADPASFAVESNGPVRAVAKWSGPLVGPQGPAGWTYLVRVELWKGGLQGWDLSVSSDLGPRKFRLLRSITLLGPACKTPLQGSVADLPLQTITGPGLSVVQDRDDHFTLQSSAGKREGQRATGVAVLQSGPARLTASVPHFWEAYPNGLAIGPAGLRVELLPRLPADAYCDPVSRKLFCKLYAWCQDGQYRVSGGQLIRRQVWLTSAAVEPQRFAAWTSEPLLPQAPPAYLCGTGVLGRPIFAQTPGVWEQYERYYEKSFQKFEADRRQQRTYGWMHFGDWFGERGLNYGNSEYDTAWATAVQWMRSGDRRYFVRGWEMARHVSSVDTVHGPAAADLNGLVYEHSFNHLGVPLTVDEVRALNAGDRRVEQYLEEYGNNLLRGAIDRQGHVFEEGNWLYAALTGDRFLRDVAERVCTNQAEKLTPRFDFSIERTAAWPLTNAVTAYRFTGNPYYLNAARLIVERVQERQDAATGGWLHWPPLDETDNVPTYGGKAFAVGVLSFGVLRYLDEEPLDRPAVRQMLVRGVDWLMNESWVPGQGFRYISNCAKYRNRGGRGLTCLLNAEIVAAAYEFTHTPRYAAFWREMVGQILEGSTSGMGKDFTQGTRQTVFALDRAVKLGIAKESPKPAP